MGSLLAASEMLSLSKNVKANGIIDAVKLLYVAITETPEIKPELPSPLSIALPIKNTK